MTLVVSPSPGWDSLPMATHRRTGSTTMQYHERAVDDPTANVLDLVGAAVLRLNDLRAAEIVRVDMLRSAESRRNDELRGAESRRVDEQASMRSSYSEKLREAESGRINAIRQVDREDVAKTASAAQTAIATLATATTNMAETLRTQVANTAIAAENRQTTYASDVNKRLSALELSSSEGKGKSQITDPIAAEMLMEIKALRMDNAGGHGRVQGIGASWATLIGVATLLAALFTMGNVLLNRIDQTRLPMTIHSSVGA